VQNIDRRDWHQFKEAILCAKYGTDDAIEKFEGFPEHLRNHEIGILISEYLFEKKKESLAKAAQLLVPNTENYWVVLERV
jgi:hypothetical protein